MQLWLSLIGINEFIIRTYRHPLRMPKSSLFIHLHILYLILTPICSEQHSCGSEYQSKGNLNESSGWWDWIKAIVKALTVVGDIACEVVRWNTHCILLESGHSGWCLSSTERACSLIYAKYIERSAQAARTSSWTSRVAWACGSNWWYY